MAGQHNLNQTSTYSLLEQRFFAIGLEADGVASVRGWADGSARGLIEAFVKEYSVSRAEAGAFSAWLAKDGDKATVLIQLDDDGSWNASAAADTQAVADEIVGKLARILPVPVTGDDMIPVRFWANGSLGPISYNRRLDSAPWSAIEGNYPSECSGAVARMMNMSVPPMAGGRLTLWHGPAGTGKTTAIRALASSIAPWADVEYIIDADEFFAHASYMVGSMVMTEDAESDRWRLLVIEDAGRYLLEGAQDKIGEGLGRLLNLTDGLVGQGLRLLVLMTTNEPAEDLHPAVTRPGRCMSNIRFGAFPAEEAAGWLAAHGVDEPEVEGDLTLAELYSMVKPMRANQARERMRSVS